MELAGSEAGHIPRCFAMDMSKDFIPMSVFSDTPQGKTFIIVWLELTYSG